MVKALIYKELRELLPWIALAAVVQVLIVSMAITNPWSQESTNPIIPFVNDYTVWFVLLTAGGLAAVMGLWQTTWESSRGSFLFLLHRPMRREVIVGTKLLFGGCVSLAVCVVPLLIYSLWAATPGTHASPFYWGMTAYAWAFAVQMPFVYLGAFLSGLRERWFGSRLLPLAGAVVVLGLLQGAALYYGWYSLVASVLIEFALVMVILLVARTRDFS